MVGGEKRRGVAGVFPDEALGAGGCGGGVLPRPVQPMRTQEAKSNVTADNIVFLFKSGPSFAVGCLC